MKNKNTSMKYAGVIFWKLKKRVKSRWKLMEELWTKPFTI